MQRWSEEVARDPRSLAFLPLARAYRKQGLRDASLQLCLRGLEAPDAISGLSAEVGAPVTSGAVICTIADSE